MIWNTIFFLVGCVVRFCNLVFWQVECRLQDTPRWKLLIFFLSSGIKTDYQRQKLLKNLQNVSFMLHVNHVLCVRLHCRFWVCSFCCPCTEILCTLFLWDCLWLVVFSCLGVKEVYYGCANDKFGGCGSILSLHSSSSEPLIRFISMPNIGCKFVSISFFLAIFWKIW